MEFMNVNLLSNKPISHCNIPPFAELRTSPKIKITMENTLVQETDNIATLNNQIGKGYKVVNISKQPPDKNYIGRLDFPRRILFEMTSHCNLLCKMCPRNNLLRPLMHIDTSIYCKTLQEINNFGVEGLWTYHLGESLMHPDFRKIIRFTENLDNIEFVWMSTNGHLLNKSNLDFIFDSRIDYINFSLHAVTEKVYKTVSPTGNFSLVLDNYNRLAAYKAGKLQTRPFVHLQMIEQETTWEETHTFIEKHHDEVEIVSINMLEYVNLPNNAFGNKQRQRKNKGHCTRINRGDCFIFSNGAVTLCDAAYNCDVAHAGALYLGNIHEQSLYDIWNGERRQHILQLENNGLLTDINICAGCTDYDI